MIDIPDWDLYKQAIRGNHLAWEQLSQRHRDRLLRMAWFLTGSVEAARDAVQVAFMELAQKHPRHHNGSLSGYLTVITRNAALKEIQRKKNTVSLDETELLSTEDNPLSRVVADERDRAIVKTIQSLDTIHRDIMVMRFYGDMSYEDIAEELMIPLGTVKSRLFHAVQKVRTSMLEAGYGDNTPE